MGARHYKRRRLFAAHIVLPMSCQACILHEVSGTLIVTQVRSCAHRCTRPASPRCTRGTGSSLEPARVATGHALVQPKLPRLAVGGAQALSTEHSQEEGGELCSSWRAAPEHTHTHACVGVCCAMCMHQCPRLVCHGAAGRNRWKMPAMIHAETQTLQHAPCAAMTCRSSMQQQGQHV